MKIIVEGFLYKDQIPRVPREERPVCSEGCHGPGWLPDEQESHTPQCRAGPLPRAAGEGLIERLRQLESQQGQGQGRGQGPHCNEDGCRGRDQFVTCVLKAYSVIPYIVPI